MNCYQRFLYYPLIASLPIKNNEKLHFLADIGKLYSSPSLGEVPQAEGYIFQHLFNPRPLAWEADALVEPLAFKARGRGF